MAFAVPAIMCSICTSIAASASATAAANTTINVATHTSPYGSPRCDSCKKSGLDVFQYVDDDGCPNDD